MNDQSTNTVLMIRPFFFRSNEQTAVNNYFQGALEGSNLYKINDLVQSEFDRVKNVLERNGVKLLLFQDKGIHDTPDSLFPNNWFSTTHNHQIILYPMFAENRRLERSQEVISYLEMNFNVAEFVDFSGAEESNVFLEGTGSLVLDHAGKIAFCCFSERSNPALFRDWCNRFEFIPVGFHAFQTSGMQRKPIYHTNVMLSIGTEWAVCCLDAIVDLAERKLVQNALQSRVLIEISEDQVSDFCANILEVKNDSGDNLIIMSQRAHNAFNAEQLNSLAQFAQLIVVDIENIEKFGGGGVRCMLAEVFLTLKS
ncbi:MAG: arginine deiminase-related protein [Flavobacteriales bacterium]